MMKYKEYRMFIFTIVFFIAIVIACFYFAMNNNMTKVIIGVILSLTIIIILSARYNMKIDKDFVLVYEFKGIGILPAIVDFKDIKEIELVSKHRLKLQHKNKSMLYLKDANSFYQELNQAIEEYKKSVVLK